MKQDVRISVKNFNFYYGNFKALKNIDMDIIKNKVTALIGPSGCGKSTFLRSLNRMNDLISNVKYEGEILLDNQNIFDKQFDIVELRKKVGMVFQKPNPFPKSIYENLVYAPKINFINLHLDYQGDSNKDFVLLEPYPSILKYY